MKRVRMWFRTTSQDFWKFAGVVVWILFQLGVASPSPVASIGSITGVGFRFAQEIMLAMVWPQIAEQAESQAASSQAASSQDADNRIEDTVIASRSDSPVFSDYLKATGLDSLAALDSIQRWQLASQSDVQWRLSWEVSVWVERQLRTLNEQQLRTKYPWLFQGTHTETPSFSVVRLIVLRSGFSEIAKEISNRGFRRQPENQSLIDKLGDFARQIRESESQLSTVFESLGSEFSVSDRLQIGQLKSIAKSSVAWCYYYRWLLRTDSKQQSEWVDELRSAKASFMQLLNVTDPDIKDAVVFKWYDPVSSSSSSYLTGLGLTLIALNELPKANSCFATLQQEGRMDQSQSLVMLQWQALVRQRDWINAKVLAVGYLDGLPSGEDQLDQRFVRIALQMFPSESTTLGSAEPPPEFVLESAPIASMVSQMLESLVRRGHVGLAADLFEKTQVALPEDRVTQQVIRLSQLITKLGIAQRTPEQLGQLVLALETLADPENSNSNTGIRVWSMDLLGQIHLIGNDWEAAIQVWQTLLQNVPSSQQSRRQNIAWKIAEAYQSAMSSQTSASQKAAQWYQAAVQEDPSSSLAAIAQLKSGLLLRNDNLDQQLRYLRSVSAASEVNRFAQKQVVGILFRQWTAALEGSDERSRLGRELQDSIMLQLDLEFDFTDPILGNSSTQFEKTVTNQIASALTADRLDVRLSLVAIWLNVLDSEAEEADKTTQLKRQCIYAAVTQVATELSGEAKSMKLEPRTLSSLQAILQSSLVVWDRAPDRKPQLVTAANWLLETPLTFSQRYMTLTYLSRGLKSQFGSLDLDPTDRDPTVEKLIQVYKDLIDLVDQQPQVAVDADAVVEWKTQLATLYFQQMRYPESLAQLDGLVDDKSPISVQQIWARILVASHKQTQAVGHWQVIQNAVLAGESDWFESQYYLVQDALGSQPIQAKQKYLSLRQLYPNIPSPWRDRFELMAVKQKW